MKKMMKLAFLICLTLLACALIFTACSGIEPQTPSNTTTTTTQAPHVHAYGDWTVVKEPSYAEEGIQTRFCTCGESQSISIAKKTPQKITLTPENFLTYFNVTYDYDYNKNKGKYFITGKISGTVVCAQSILGDLENVSVTIDLYPRGGYWDEANFGENGRVVNLVIPSTTGVATVSKEMTCSMADFFSEDARKPDSIDFVITSVTGTITIYS